MHPVYVRGTAVHRSWSDPSSSLPELIFATTRAALADAGLTAADVDSVVLSAHDLVDGRSLSNMVTAPAAAAYLKDEVRIGDDGAQAFLLATARVRSGASQVSVVAAWGRASEADVDAVSHALFDPFLTRPLGLTEVGVSAMRATAALSRYPDYSSWRERAASRRASCGVGTGRRPPRAVPLREEELPVWSDVVTCAVLSGSPGPVRVVGAGASTEPYDIGDRDLLGLPALRQATERALRAPGWSVDDADVLEIDGLTLFDEALALEAVGAAPAGLGMRFVAERDDVNLDGGYLAGYCAPAMGLVRICRAVERLQHSGHRAVATGSSVVAAQTQAAVALERT